MKINCLFYILFLDLLLLLLFQESWLLFVWQRRLNAEEWDWVGMREVQYSYKSSVKEPESKTLERSNRE
jgi:hypothetical protein